MSKEIIGVIPPIITPIDEHENVDEKGLRALIDHCIEHGIHGIFVCGSNGECMSLTQEQRNCAIQITLDECAGRVPVIAGCMDSSTQRVIDNIKALEDMGGKTAVVTSVFYARHATQYETVRHFEEISKHTNADLMIYNIPPSPVRISLLTPSSASPRLTRSSASRTPPATSPPSSSC